MTTVNAKVYIARILGGESSQEAIDMAGEALLRGYQDWESRKFWGFLLKDTSSTTAVTITATKSSAIVSAPSSGTFDFVNVGQSVTYVGAAGTLAAATVSTVTRGSDGTVTSITLSAAFGGGAYVTESGVLTFSANIPMIAGSNDYSLPNDFLGPYTARTLTNKTTLTWRDQRYWDRTIVDQTVQGTPDEYVTYNPQSELTQNFGNTRLKFDRIPSANDTLFLRYYRRFTTTGTNVDMPDSYLYQFLDYCRNILLQTKMAQDDPQGYAAMATQATESADVADEFRTDDEDVDSCMKSQYEMGPWNRPLWSNGPFDPYPY